jgi:hypothetical protein
MFSKGYRIQRVRGDGLKFVCLQCPYNVNTLDFDVKVGHVRTQAASALHAHIGSAHPVKAVKKLQSELIMPPYANGKAL